MKKAILVFGMVFLAGSSGSRLVFGSDGSAGSVKGGDGLILSSQTGDPKGDVVVPVPSDLEQWATITVNGDTGASQNDWGAAVSWCPAGADGKPDSDNSKCKVQFGALSSPIKVRAGFVTEISYMPAVYSAYSWVSRLSYSVAMPLAVHSGNQLTFSLKKIDVPKVDSTYRYSVYVDLTDPNEQEMFRKWHPVYTPDELLQSVVLGSENKLTCPPRNCEFRVAGRPVPKDASMAAEHRAICDAVVSGALPAGERLRHLCKNYGGTTAPGDLLAFYDDGAYKALYAKCQYENGSEGVLGRHKYVNVTYCDLVPDGQKQYWTVTDPSDGTFISVFPGVYGIIFRAQDGQTSTVNGVHVD